MRVWIGFHSCVQRVKYQGIVVMVADDVSNDSVVIQVKYRAEIHLIYIRSFVPLELCHIRQPLLIRHIGMELPVQPILCVILRIGSLPGTAVVLVLNGGLDIQAAADAQYPFLVHIYLVVMSQIILDPAVAFVRILCMNLLHKFRNLLVFQLPGALFAAKPAVVGRSGHAQLLTGQFHRIPIFFLTFSHCQIDVRLPYLAQSRLLSISSNFISR